MSTSRQILEQGSFHSCPRLKLTFTIIAIKVNVIYGKNKSFKIKVKNQKAIKGDTWKEYT